jgi:hypothetical protein
MTHALLCVQVSQAIFPLYRLVSFPIHICALDVFRATNKIKSRLKSLALFVRSAFPCTDILLVQVAFELPATMEIYKQRKKYQRKIKLSTEKVNEVTGVLSSSVGNTC